MGFFARLKNFFKPEKKAPVLGLALGSGGAKGLAHLGALKAFEEAGIAFSVITGSSIGAIVGALYAKGYSSEDMIRIIEGLNRREFSKNLRPFADLTFAENFLSGYLEGEISSLNIPFGAWVTDGDTNEGVPITSGKLARVVTASAAIPPFFRGVEMDGKKYYDGAFSNAVPSDLCKQLGAEIVIGIDLAAFMRNDEERGALYRFVGSAISSFMPVKYTEDCRTRGYINADVMLRPNLHDFAAVDISASAMNAMFEIGYAEAKAHIEEIKKLIEGATKRGKQHKKKERSRL